ncbi:bifunctional nicotinamidase/pyrazinamidase [Pseudomonas indica]|uniref:Nicotinamidase n=1 Tax=Pseudomonas indica TaxID=137658 RepID=A0A1G9BVD5_9PSED|nr:bifunctional nicotinamidase/pyrazinamidase [Pseudomonas indica]SDK43340.1 nicotinamidase/pyrazinamidase [Pseudomonas indica]
MKTVLCPDAHDLLLVIDVQNDFCAGGALAIPSADAVVAPINRLAQCFAHIVLTQDWRPADHWNFADNHPGRRPFDTIHLAYGAQALWPSHCVQGSRGADFHPGLRLSRAELILRKGYRSGIDSYSAFYENDRSTPTGLSGYLKERGIRRLFLAGLATDYCVLYSALDARRERFQAVLLEEACRGLDIEGSVAKALQAMRGAGIDIWQTA